MRKHKMMGVLSGDALYIAVSKWELRSPVLNTTASVRVVHNTVATNYNYTVDLT